MAVNMQSDNSISIIVPFYNESSTIDVLQKQLMPHVGEAEIIFVDGGSTDGSADMVDPAFKLIRSEKGRAVQMNRGAVESCGNVLFFLHCDSVLPYDFMDELRETASKCDYACFGVKFPSRNFLMLTNRVLSNFRAFRRGLPFCDQGIIIRRELFMRMGMFPQIPVHEDFSFGIKMRAAGYYPKKTRQRLTTSMRRYGKGTLSIARTEYSMWLQRRRFLRGEDPEQLAREYRDIR